MENEELNLEELPEDAAAAAAAEEAAEAEKRWNKDEVQRIVNARLASVQRGKEELKRENEQLREQLARNGSGAPAAAAASGDQQTRMTPEQAEKYYEAKQKLKKFDEQIMEAEKQDKEFAELVQKHTIPPEILNPILQFLGTDESITNGPAVIKHLLKDKRANRLTIDKAQAAFASQDASILRSFLYDISDKVEKNTPKAKSSDFEPPADFSDVGESGSELDEMSDYISSKY